jgi:hypothetical protein
MGPVRVMLADGVPTLTLGAVLSPRTLCSPPTPPSSSGSVPSYVRPNLYADIPVAGCVSTITVGVVVLPFEPPPFRSRFHSCSTSHPTS